METNTNTPYVFRQEGWKQYKMVNQSLLDLLKKYQVDRDFSAEIREGYRNPLEDNISSYLKERPNYRYGGSLAKGTANTNSCDIDLLCYMDSNSHYSVKDLYEEIAKSLESKKFIIEKKNSAICVSGKYGDQEWGTTVDVVPGKYTHDDSNKDVFLWCNRDQKRLKSNPEIQIGKVKNSNYKDLVRLIKLYRTFKGFKFKSFYLEIFIIDYLANSLSKEKTLYENLVTFTEHANEIGKIKLLDPANSANDISDIHSPNEFKIIRDNLNLLHEALLTNDPDTILNCLQNKQYDIDGGYLSNCKSHSSLLNLKAKESFFTIAIRGQYLADKVWIDFNSSSILKPGLKLKFTIKVPLGLSPKDISLIISNGGYDSTILHKCPRGAAEPTFFYVKDYNFVTRYRKEYTSYIGNHVVQAIVTTRNNLVLFSAPFIVKVR